MDSHPGICQRTGAPAPCKLRADMPALLERIYRARGIATAEELTLQLDQLPPPDTLLGVEAAVQLLQQALDAQQSLLVVGDFDADGATSTALALLGLRALGFERVDYLVPNRFEYGYGLTAEIVALIVRERRPTPDLIITVDNGISSLDGVDAANAAGIRVLITDHHLPGNALPAAAAIVNPNQPGCGFPGKHLAGVGVMFYLLMALRARLRADGWFARSRAPEPNLAVWLDLVALGTIADVAVLDQSNRILVHQGVQRIRAGRARPGILALLELAGRDHRRLVAADLGFAVGPRLNAAGRLDDMGIGIRCLLAEDATAARPLAAQLDELNRDRRAIETDMQRQALELVATLDCGGDQLPWGLCLFDATWHAGVVGLLAGRLKDRLQRPVIAFAGSTVAGEPTGSEEIKGSARSIPGLHIRDTLEAVAARHPELLRKFGGHAMAAGLSLRRDRFDDFSRAFDAEVRRRLGPQDLSAVISTDGQLAPAEITLETARQLRDAGPWGQGFPEPCFHGEFEVVSQRLLAERHLRLQVSVADNESNKLILNAIAFNVVGEDWARAVPQRLVMVYRLDVNVFRGTEALQLLVERLLL